MATTTVTTDDVGYSPQIISNKTCFAHRHLTVEEYGLWTHARQLAHESGIFYFDGRKIAQRFGETGKNTIYRIGKNLIRKGWLVILRKPKRLKNGMFSPGQYRPVSHEEWAAKHPGACLEFQTGTADTSPGIGTGEDGTSPGIENDLSQNRERPVLESGHNSKGVNIKGECEEETDTHTSSLRNTVEGNEEEVKTKQTSDSLPSKNNTLAGKAREIKPDQTSLPPPSKTTSAPNHPVQSSKITVAAPPAPDEDAIIAHVWAHYLGATGRDPMLNTLTPARRKLGKVRLHECLLKVGGKYENAEKLMCFAIDALTRSDWHMGRDPKTHGKSYNDWERNIFKSYETMERLWN
jgi:hypothetical protein